MGSPFCVAGCELFLPGLAIAYKIPHFLHERHHWVRPLTHHAALPQRFQQVLGALNGLNGGLYPSRTHPSQRMGIGACAFWFVLGLGGG